MQYENEESYHEYKGNSGKGILGVITGVLMYASGWVSNIWWILIILMGIDYLTGVVAAVINRCVSSEVGWKGIVRKAGILILTVVCMLVDYAVDNLSSGIGFHFPLQGMVTHRGLLLAHRQ